MPGAEHEQIQETNGTESPMPRRMLGNLRVPARMLIVVLVPLLAAIGFAGLRVNDSLEKAERYRDIERIIKTSRTGSHLIKSLAQERDLAVDPRARGRLTGVKDGKGRSDTDVQAEEFLRELAELPARASMERQRKVTVSGLNALTKIRKSVDSGDSATDVGQEYDRVIISIGSLYNLVTGIGDEARGPGWTLYTITLNDIMVTSQRAMLSNAVQSGRLSPGQQGNILSSQVGRDITAMEFDLYAQHDEAATFQSIFGDSRARNLAAAIHTLGSSTGPVNLRKTLPRTWYEDLTRISEQLGELQGHVETRVLASALAQKDKASAQVVTDASIAALVLLMAAAIVVATSRHLVRGLAWLRRSALRVADVHIPEVTRHLSKGRELPRALEGKVLAPSTRDEIGDVGRAFDRVYLEAIRLARQQAGMREEVNLLFQNLSRRNQALVQRQLAVITELESHERDPEELARLFHLDHLAVQIRRNSENLLVLAGAEITAERRETTELLVLVRTAASEIEEYQRVTYRGVPAVGVVGYAADDLVHLVAELLDNAASFSSPDTWVVVTGRRLPDGRLLLEIRDAGIGMSAEQFTTAERVLRQPAGSRTGLSTSMGLYVVGALARKHEVDVRLYGNTPSGVVATLVLPATLLEQSSPTSLKPTLARRRRRGPGPGAAQGQSAQSSLTPRRSQDQDPSTMSMRAVGTAANANAGATAQPQHTPEDESTNSGLPVRQRRVRSGSVSARGPRANGSAAFPDPAEIQRRMSGLSDGIAHARPNGEESHARD
ncbi:sensor histidine kinase [Streptomyces sp. NPDC055709]